MRSHSLDLTGNPTTVALILGIAIANSSRERDGVALGIPERTSKDFTVLFGFGDNAPEIKDDRVVDCWPLIGTQVERNDQNKVWLESTPADQREVNKSVVHVTGYSGYTLIQGSPKVYASGIGACIMRLKPNSAIQFLTPTGKAFVLYTNNDATMPQVIQAEKFEPKFLTEGVAPVSTVRDEVPTGTSR